MIPIKATINIYENAQQNPIKNNSPKIDLDGDSLKTKHISSTMAMLKFMR
jgi:hypothetical protein